MRLSNNLRSELDVLLWANGDDKTLNKHLKAHLVAIGEHKRQNAVDAANTKNATAFIGQPVIAPIVVARFADIFGVELPLKYQVTKLKPNPKNAKPIATGYSANRSITELEKYQNQFWNESCYSHELLRHLYSRIARCVSQRGMWLDVSELVVIAEDIIPHILSIELCETYAYTSVTSAIERNELLLEMYHTREISKAECLDGLSKNVNYPLLETIDDFLKILFKECYNYRFIFPLAVNQGVADAYSIGRQYRQGIGYHTGLTDDIIRWLDDGGIVDYSVETLEPITVDDIKTELIEGDYHRQSFYAVDFLIERNAGVNRNYLSRYDIETLMGVTEYASREIVKDLRRAAIAVQSRR